MPDTLVAPAYCWVPDRVSSYGSAAVDLAREAGRELDAEQELAVDALLSTGAGGRPLTLESGVVEARQNGKTGGILLPVALYDLFLGEPDRVVWTAHLFRTSRDAFADFCGRIEFSSWLSRRVKKITYANGEESIELKSGARLDFLARSKGGGRGLGGRRLIMDEAGFLSAESMGALVPTLSARPEPQIIYASSAGFAGSDQLRHLRDRGRAGDDPSLIWVEWCAPGGWDSPPCRLGVDCTHRLDAVGCALDDETLWRLANPAMGRRITVEYIRAERRALPLEEFGRERLGWFDLADGDQAWAVIRQETWLRLADRDSKIVGPVWLSADATADLSVGCVGAAGHRGDGLVHVEYLEHRPGTAWLTDRIEELCKAHEVAGVVVDPKRQAGRVILDLEARGIRVVQTTAREMAQACSLFFEAVTETKLLRHLGQAELDAALAGAQKRNLEGAWAWDGRGNITALVAVTLAAWGLSQAPPPQIFGSWR